MRANAFDHAAFVFFKEFHTLKPVQADKSHHCTVWQF